MIEEVVDVACRRLFAIMLVTLLHSMIAVLTAEVEEAALLAEESLVVAVRQQGIPITSIRSITCA
jgi:hypothetical protein